VKVVTIHKPDGIEQVDLDLPENQKYRAFFEDPMMQRLWTMEIRVKALEDAAGRPNP